MPGLSDLRVASLATDTPLLEAARKDATAILHGDSTLAQPRTHLLTMLPAVHVRHSRRRAQNRGPMPGLSRYRGGCRSNTPCIRGGPTMTITTNDSITTANIDRYFPTEMEATYLNQVLDIDGNGAVILASEPLRNGSGRVIGTAYTVTAGAWDFVQDCVRRGAEFNDVAEQQEDAQLAAAEDAHECAMAHVDDSGRTSTAPTQIGEDGSPELVPAALLDRAMDLLREASRLGLRFDRGNAYIRAIYITKQNALCEQIADLEADVERTSGSLNT